MTRTFVPTLINGILNAADELNYSIKISLISTKKTFKNLISETHFTIKIPYNKKVLETQNVPRKTDEQKIIEMIKNNPKTTRKEMAKAIGKTVKTVQRIINENNNVKFVGSSKSGHWEIIE